MRIALTETQIALSALCGLLLLALVYQLSAPLSEPVVPTIELHEKAVTPTAPASFAAPPPSHFAEIDNRPVFNPTRKPIARSPAQGAQAATPPPPNLSLIGTITDGEKVLALVKTPGAAFATSLSVGTSVGGWQVSDIKPDRIVLHAGTTDHEILLNSNAAAPSAPQKN